MSDNAIPVYAFNPDEDEIRFNDQLENGMRVLPEAPGLLGRHLTPVRNK